MHSVASPHQLYSRMANISLPCLPHVFRTSHMSVCMCICVNRMVNKALAEEMKTIHAFTQVHTETHSIRFRLRE